MSPRFIIALALVISLFSIPVLGEESPGEEQTELGLDPEGLPRELNGFQGEIRGLWRDGRVFVGGQPDEAALKRFAEMGVTAVVNLRTTVEMDDRDRVPFDEASLVKALGMEYVHIPLGGEDHPYTPEAVARFADVLERHGELVLLHCTVAWRASYMWSAYLISEQGYDLDGALARGEAMGIGELPIEGLLGRPLVLAYAD